MWRELQLLLSMIRFSHTLFALPFALLAAVMAWAAPLPNGAGRLSIGWHEWLGIVLCMAFARSAAMAFNRIADRELDSTNPRTATRHLPAKTLALSSVLCFTVLNALGFIASTLLFLPNRLPIFLAIPVLAFLCGYSYTKRFTAGAHFWLGAALMLAPISTWIALRGEYLVAYPSDILPAAWLGIAVLCWVAGFDIIYACQDVDHDRRAKLHSIPAAVGVRSALRLAAFCHLTMIGFLITLPQVHRWGGPILPLGAIYWTGTGFVAALLLYEHSIVRPDDLTRVNVAFFQVNAVVSLGLFLVASVDLIF